MQELEKNLRDKSYKIVVGTDLLTNHLNTMLIVTSVQSDFDLEPTHYERTSATHHHKTYLMVDKAVI